MPPANHCPLCDLRSQIAASRGQIAVAGPASRHAMQAALLPVEAAYVALAVSAFFIGHSLCAAKSFAEEMSALMPNAEPPVPAPQSGRAS